MTGNLLTAIGFMFALRFESQIFPFMLSSAFTARTAVPATGQTAEVKTDLQISLAFSIGASVLIGSLLKNWPTIIFGTVFGFVLYYTYLARGLNYASTGGAQ